jgi:integrase
VAKKDLTPLSVQNAKPRRRGGRPILTEISDTTKGLRLLVHPTGSKAWILRYRIGTRSRKLTLGNAIPLDKGASNPNEVLTLAVARKMAADAQIQIEQGIDPAIKKQEQQQQRQRQQDANAETFEYIAEKYFARWMHDNKDFRSAERQLTDLRRLVFPELGNRPIKGIRRSDVKRALNAIKSPTMADAMLAVISKVMQEHASNEDDYNSVIVKGMRRIKKPKERARSRVLDDDELRAVWKAASEDGVFGAFVKFLLLTAARRNEAAMLTAGEIGNGNGMVWTLPASRNKTKIELIRPLSKAAQQVLAGLPRGDADELVFQDDRRVVASNLNPMKKEFDQRCGVTGWILHDLRRTARTLLSRAGVSDNHSERCLGHVIGGVKGVYDRHKYIAEMKVAYEALATLIENITNPQANVVPLHG